MKYIQPRLLSMTFALLSFLLMQSALTAEAQEHQLNVTAKPAIAGSFNQHAATLAAGESIHLYAYANSSFTFVNWVDEKGTVISEQMDFTYTMPERDVQLTATYEYNPANPGNPATNYWNKELGEVIVDDFKPGQLQTAVMNAIGNSNTTDVAMITVAGVMSSNDFGIVNNCTNCSLLDLSRVSGITQVPSYAFDCTNLESVYLPATIEKIGYRAFYECKQLSSLTVYAMMPPSLENDVFTNVPDGLVVYVPASAITQYQDAAGWKDFTILPIQEDIRSLSVSLPEGTNASDYAQMWLELTNTKSGQRMHYVMTGRTLYSFANIIRNTSWNVTLRNERGDVFGKIDNVEVKDEDVSVTFASLSKPQTVTLSVLAPDGQDVTGQTQVTWTDGSGNYIAQGTSLSALPVGYQLNYSVALSQDLAMLYGAPNLTAYTLKDGGNSQTCKLENIKQVQITGKVKDVSTGMALSGAVVSASQTFGGKYSKTINGKTDANGVFTLIVANVPTSLAFAATDYISQSVNLDNGLNELNELADVLLKPISGATITVGFNYTTVDGETQNWYSDYQNVGYTLYNKTRKQPIGQFNVQYPQIVLLEEVSEGDVLELTAESKTQSFMPVKATATITANQTAETQFSIVELGQLKAEYSQSGNVNVVASLYDSNGKLLKTYDYQDMSLTVSNLSDGNYTLVSMGSSQFFNSIYDLAQLPQTGLKAGTDYVQNAISVKSGAVTTVHIDLVPKLDESKLYYTGDNTSFTVNKPSIVAGNYLTLTGRIDFKQAYAANVSNVQMIIDLPESCEFVENSVMVGNSTGRYMLNGHQLTIPMARYTDRVRFCIIPTVGGEYAPSAFVQFDLKGETVTQPIGSASYTAKHLSISVPATVSRTSIPISGTSFGSSSVEIYDNGILIGQTTSLSNGTWSTTCELNDPYNLTLHNIYARIVTKAGLELQSETVGCLYDMTSVGVSTVTMVNTAHPASSLNTCEYVTEFDFHNPQKAIPAYWYWPSYPSFTFITKFNSAHPNDVDNVYVKVKTSAGDVVPIKCVYDAKSDGWIALHNFYSGNLPVNVGVGYDINISEMDSESVCSTIKGYVLQNNTQTKKNLNSQVTQISENNCRTTTKIGDVDLSVNTQMSIKKSIPNITSYEALPVSDTENLYKKFDAATNVIEMLLPSHFCRTIGAMLPVGSNEREQMMAICESMDENDVLHVQSLIEEHAPVGVSTILGIAENLVSFSDRARRCYDMIQKQKQKLLRMQDCEYAQGQLDFLNSRLNNLFDQYFKIEAMSTGMQCITVGNANPLAAIPLMGKIFEATAELALRHRLIAIGNEIKTYENSCKADGQYMSDEEVESMCGNVAYVMDPSGCVYEGVLSNRLEGVTATAYYKETVEDMYGDLHENIVKWDASEYAQENPLFTDEYGMYAWDVPQGLWQVKFEKEGYETTYSEWLPVPPPQLDVNIAMKQSKQPEVKAARAYEDAVEVEFDKYMIPDLLNIENIIVLQNGEAVEGTLELLNNESAYEGSEEAFASKVRFNATQPFTESEVTLMVSNSVKSYAGVCMQDNYQQTFAIEQEIRQIVSDEQVTIDYGDNVKLTVSVLPASASRGKVLTVKTSSPMILGVETEQVVIDNDGKAEITISGELPGTAALTFSVEGSDKTATTIANIEMSAGSVATPTADIASGTLLNVGSKIELSSETDGATIYYTTDGSCPCDEATRLEYSEPIVITRGVVIKAIAVKNGMDDSEVAEFTYGLIGDANGDGVVDVADVVAVVNKILNKASGNFNEAAANVNGDEGIDVADVVGIVNIILGKRTSARGEKTDMVMTYNDRVSLCNLEDGSLSLCLENEGSYVAAQFDIRLSDGQQLEGITLNNGRADGHCLTYSQVEPNLWRVLIYSMDGAALRGNDGELLNIRVTGSVSIGQIFFVMPDMSKRQFSPLDSQLTGIGSYGILQSPADVYSTDGRLVKKQATSLRGLPKGVYIIRGQKFVNR